MNTQRMIMRFSLPLVGLTLFAAPVVAQVFDTVINVPPSPDIVSNFADPASIGGDGLATQLNLFGDGSIGTQFDVFSGGELNITGGTLDSFANAHSGSEVNISSGMLGIGFDANSGSVINASGGSVGSFFDARFGSEVNISGGIVGDGFTAGLGSTINISGGSFDGTFFANAGIVDDSVPVPVVVGSQINLFGSNFVLDNMPLVAGLTAGEAFTIFDRDVVLSGQLADGSQFSFALNSVRSFGEDFFDPDATVTVTLVDSSLLGDVNLDNSVNFLDISPFIALLSSGEFQAEADIDGNGFVNFLDISPFIGILAD